MSEIKVRCTNYFKSQNEDTRRRSMTKCYIQMINNLEKSKVNAVFQSNLQTITN